MIKYLWLFVILFVSCVVQTKIKDGYTAYERKQYAVAVNMFNEEYNNGNNQSERAKLAYFLGESYTNMGNLLQAQIWYNKANQLGYGTQALLKEAYALKKLERYNQAIGIFQELDRQSIGNTNYKREIAICRLAAEWKEKINDSEFIVQSLELNTDQSEYAPVKVGYHQLFFSSDRQEDRSENTYKWTGRGFSDIYIHDLNNHSTIKLDPNINSKNNEGTISLNEDGNVLFFTRCFSESEEVDDYCRLMSSNLQANGWSKPEFLPFQNDDTNYGHPFWYEPDSLLFFSSKQQLGYGGFDIFYSKLDTSSNWSNPILLSRKINTEGDEKFPFIQNDTLYFSSDGHLGMGGLDVFYSYVDQNGEWVTPYNMKAPINSGADDFGFYKIGDQNEYGYFSSSRNQSDDIFLIKKRKITKDPITETEEPNTGSDNLFLAITLKEKSPTGEISISKDITIQINNQSAETLKNEKGFVIKDIDQGSYEVTVSKKGFFTQSKSIISSNADIPDGQKNMTYNMNFVLEPIITGAEIVLENIFYDFNEYVIREDAKPALDELTQLLNDNPSISIQLSSHTDCRGNDEFNMRLSQQRAQAAVDYIVQNGIAPNRIIAKGYGESDPAINCVCDDCTEEQHQLNRRTSFQVLSIE